MYMTLLLGLSIGIVFFIVSFIGFRAGLRLGMTTAQGKTPEPIKPVQTIIKTVQGVKESKEQAEANKSFTDGFNSIMSYTGDLKGE
jgi:hypothetical protein